jgi:hypothetical protein
MPKNKSPRVHWYSNHPDMPTGYGTQSAQVLRRMRKRGHSLTIQANYGHMGSVGKWESSRVFPVGYETWSHDIMFQHYREVRRESSDPIPFFTLADVWVFKGKAWDDIDQIVSWVPIDHGWNSAAGRAVAEARERAADCHVKARGRSDAD